MPKQGNPGLFHTDSYLLADRHLAEAPAEHYELRAPDTTLPDQKRGWPHLASVHAASRRPAALAWRSAGVASAMHGQP